MIYQTYSNLSRQIVYNCLKKLSRIVEEWLNCLDGLVMKENHDKFGQFSAGNRV